MRAIVGILFIIILQYYLVFSLLKFWIKEQRTQPALPKTWLTCHKLFIPFAQSRAAGVPRVCDELS